MTEYLTVGDLLKVNAAVLGAEWPAIRDAGLVAAAAARPAATVFGEDAYPDLAGKVAAMMHSLVRSHPFLDGNKRTGWVAARLLARLNDHTIALTENEAFDLVVELAAVDTEVPALAKRLKVEPIT
ncbi:type II toxin-antitoxin system death-on-curing family toxin [Nocardia bovistercoris]|uniref:Type II toxin-antitoxin system death-on-curing family toxin n=1 Tax=Nocardia bovistercoris TaxID=2785916 RepID=A0A931N4B0_9NOCA|nr:type II toxin-antitoxin system death-on-curing family toxin [Nocardia bovistercoris]